jgi:hypothetical protein
MDVIQFDGRKLSMDVIFNQYAMKVDTQPFPAVNMVEVIYPEGSQPGPTFSINVVGPGNYSGKD